MKFEFDPQNNIIQLCLQGMILERNEKPEEANMLFQKAWNESTNDFERFYAAYHVARYQETTSDKLIWLKKALQFALRIDSAAVASALSTVYSSIAKCYEDSGDLEKMNAHFELADLSKLNKVDKGPFYHGTRADLQVGELLTAGGHSNYQPELKMNHIYFTAMVSGAALAAALASGEERERVYIVEPLGSFEDDPNVTDKMFPGNPTRSFRSTEPLKIIGEATEWVGLSPEERRQWREKLEKDTGTIIN